MSDLALITNELDAPAVVYSLDLAVSYLITSYSCMHMGCDSQIGNVLQYHCWNYHKQFYLHAV